MRIYFLRHGVAEDWRPGITDAERRLTVEGVEEMRVIARAIRALGLRFDAILTSPLARARETAAIVADALQAEDRLREEPLLEPECRYDDLIRVLEGQPAKAHVLLVGHEPDCSTLIADLIGGGRVRMKKAALACVEWHGSRPGDGELRWLLNPEQLRRVREAEPRC
jgi:phosphohistidine phosphatase